MARLLMAGQNPIADADIVLTVSCGQQLLTTIGGVKVLVRCDESRIPDPTPRHDHPVDMVDLDDEIPTVHLPNFDPGRVAYINVGNVIAQVASDRGLDLERGVSAVRLPGIASVSVHGHEVDGSTLRDLLTHASD